MIYGTSTNTFPDDAYGVDTDSYYWADDFSVNKSQKEKLMELWSDYQDVHHEYLVQSAELCGLDTSEWEREDWLEFEELLDDYK